MFSAFYTVSAFSALYTVSAFSALYTVYAFSAFYTRQILQISAFSDLSAFKIPQRRGPVRLRIQPSWGQQEEEEG